jgi:hypothetical protein
MIGYGTTRDSNLLFQDLLECRHVELSVLSQAVAF